MYRVYISASTQDKNIGVNQYGTEQDRMHQLADRVKYWLNTQGKFTVFRNEKGWSLGQTVNDCNNLSCELFVDNHTNAPGGEGTETYYHAGSENGKRIAEILYAKIAPISPGKDRKVKEDSTLYPNGLYVLRKTIPPATLIEHFFHTNNLEVAHFLGNIDKYAKAEAQAICEYFGEKWIEPEEKSTKMDIAITIDGEHLKMDVQPINIDGRVMVPVRFIAESLGCTVDWDEQNKIVNIKKGGN